MATTKSTDAAATRRIKEGESFGLLANGASGAWEVAIDEATSGDDRWFVQMEGPAIAFYFEIPTLDTIAKMAQFLEARATQGESLHARLSKSPDSLVIGKDKLTSITLVKDDEYEDRFFLVVGPMSHPIVRFVIAGTDGTQLVETLRQVQEDLDDED